MDRSNSLAVIDFGGQYAHLIATKFRNNGYFAEIRNPEDPPSLFAQYGGIVISGSPNLSAFDEEGGSLGAIMELEVPILGFCFGHQEIAKHCGGEVLRVKQESGPATLRVVSESPIFAGIPSESQVFMSHGDTVSAIGEGFTEIGVSSSTGSAPHRFAAIADERRKRYGFQYHPEVDDSVYGEAMLLNFAGPICGLTRSWSVVNSLADRLDSIREQVGDRDVFLLVSGGVDSTVLGELLIKALGPERVHLLHVDTGFMREQESEAVSDIFRAQCGDNYHVVRAHSHFIDALEGVTAPEQKRNIIGEAFVTVCEEEMQKLDLSHALLAQGTIYPDTVESGGERRAKVIKTHHNRVKLMEEMIARGQVIEPLADLYKKEVRELGYELGIPRDLLERHPFPGPGLAVRLLASTGTVPEGYVPEAASEAQEWLPEGFTGVILPIPSVGVKADLRSYELPLWLEPSSAGVPDESVQQRLFSLVPTLVKEVPGINRVLVNLSAPLNEVSPREAYMTRDRIELLREADHRVNTLLAELGLVEAVWQFPVVLVPLKSGKDGKEVVVLRPVETVRAMTCTVPVLPRTFYDRCVQELMTLPGVGAVALDITTKPPGTIELE